jgi:glycosyltransferase involved in cell wall biosynthesis
VRHFGAPLDPALGDLARGLARSDRRYRYAGALPHGLARAAIRSAHLLVHPSVVEGGANVIVEAITAGTPVLASRISGNIGMLGRDYPGFFEPRDAAGLAARLALALEDPRELACLRSACEERKPLFRPRAEASAIAGLAAALVAQR